MKSGIHLIGGFAGIETAEDFQDRDKGAHRTTLVLKATEGSMVSAIRIQDAVIESISLTGATAAQGAGISIVDSVNVQVRCCHITDNTATLELV
jgi:hypothetical protein